MMYERVYSAQFRKDVRLAAKRGKDLLRLEAVIDALANGEVLPATLRDHALKGRYDGYRECHVDPDWLLVYKIDKGLLVLVLYRVSTHSDLFD
jgi:mRNA interferase YafQ